MQFFVCACISEVLQEIIHVYRLELWVFSFVCNYTLYKNPGFWLVNSRCIFIPSRLPETCWEVVSHSDWQTWRSCQTEKYFAGPKKKLQKIHGYVHSVLLAFLECFTIVLVIGHLISHLGFIEVKVIQFLVFSVVHNCICYVFYSVCLVFGLSSFLALFQSIECKFFTIRQYLWQHSDCVKFNNSNIILITSISEIKQ
jgi:hypothetical protein